VIELKILKEFYDCLRNMERVSKNILFAGVVMSFLIYLSSLTVLFIYALAMDDFTTGMYWYKQLSELSVRILAAGTAPVFIFEILCISRGLKKEKSKGE